MKSLVVLLCGLATVVVACPSPKSVCSLGKPIVSDDACNADGDCAPSVPCHAPACVARAKAQLPAPGQICTEEMRCATADANQCSCSQGRCTLAPRSHD